MTLKHLACTCGLLAVSLFGADQTATNQQPQAQKEDPRVEQLRNFFLAQRSPLAKHAESFLSAAEKHGLDWRLLPSLAMVETGGVKTIHNNNVFGWGNGKIRFESISESIHVIAERLTNALPYRNKTVEGKLKAYNPVNKSYAEHVLGIMKSISPHGFGPMTASVAAPTADPKQPSPAR